jgi:hypothetical protein
MILKIQKKQQSPTPLFRCKCVTNQLPLIAIQQQIAGGANQYCLTIVAIIQPTLCAQKCRVKRVGTFVRVKEHKRRLLGNLNTRAYNGERLGHGHNFRNKKGPDNRNLGHKSFAMYSSPE